MQNRNNSKVYFGIGIFIIILFVCIIAYSTYQSEQNTGQEQFSYEVNESFDTQTENTNEFIISKDTLTKVANELRSEKFIKSTKEVGECPGPFSDSGIIWNFEKFVGYPDNLPYTRVSAISQWRCGAEGLSDVMHTYEPSFDLGTHLGYCSEIKPGQKGVGDDNTDETAAKLDGIRIARVQCLVDGVGYEIGAYSRGDLMFKLLEIREASTSTPSFRGNSVDVKTYFVEY